MNFSDRLLLNVVLSAASLDKELSTAETVVSKVRTDLIFDFGVGLEALHRLHESVHLARCAPRRALEFRSPELCHTEISRYLHEAKTIIDQIEDLRSVQLKTFALDKAVADAMPAYIARDAGAQLRDSGLLRFISSKWRKAKNLAQFYTKEMCDRIGPNELDAFARYRELLDELDTSAALRRAIGPHFAGIETPVEDLLECHVWFQALMTKADKPPFADTRLGEALWVADRATIDALAKIADHHSWSSVVNINNFFEERRSCGEPFQDTIAMLMSVLEPVCSREFTVAILKSKSAIGWDGVNQLLADITNSRRRADQAEALFIDRTGLDEARWWLALKSESINDRLARVRCALAEPGKLAEWLSFDQTVGEVFNGPASKFAQQAIGGFLPLDRLVDLYDHCFFDALARDVLSSRPAVRALGLKQHWAIRKRYRALDERVMELRRACIVHDLSRRSIPRGHAGATVGDFTDLELIRREIGKRKRHLPIRQLVDRAGAALQALTPCFMMGPMSVAQFLPPGNLAFDLIIFDEASQVRPEDAIGAIARGGQVVVVGDENQLPPTSFFERMNLTDGDDDDDSPKMLADDGLAVGAIAESILQLAETRYPRSRLRWHYRSAHDSLIAFSNRHFYDGELLIFPSPTRTNRQYGIGFSRVDGGVFEAGRNIVEADTVAEAAIRFLRTNPNRSLGVVAMNAAQATRIQDLVEERTRSDPALLNRAEDYENQVEPFFIKNLENVQGDERDVIMISMTYGPANPGGRVKQNFGPINQQDGWRRLNVLFTRAKERMEVFSSMIASDILVDGSSSRGVHTLRNFLEYAETGRLEPKSDFTGSRPPDSDFEMAVYDGLCLLGYRCDLQVGASGFFIDLAVHDPDQPGRYILGIECDGASYHSTASARDRDRLRVCPKSS